jgi:hypothetical protein
MEKTRKRRRRGRPTEIKDGSYIGLTIDGASLRRIDALARIDGADRSKIVRKLILSGLEGVQP